KQEHSTMRRVRWGQTRESCRRFRPAGTMGRFVCFARCERKTFPAPDIPLRIGGGRTIRRKRRSMLWRVEHLRSVSYAGLCTAPARVGSVEGAKFLFCHNVIVS